MTIAICLLMVDASRAADEILTNELVIELPAPGQGWVGLGDTVGEPVNETVQLRQHEAAEAGLLFQVLERFKGVDLRAAAVNNPTRWG